MKNQNNLIAVVDIQAIVGASAQVRALKEEQLNKSRELAQWLQNARAQVSSEQDKAKQDTMLQQYNAEFARRRTEIAQHYQQELKTVSGNIEQTIAEEAKNKGYQLVLAKNVTIYGGDDITAEIAKIIK